MTSRKKINEMIDRYLADRKPNEDGRYAKVTNSEMRQLWTILTALLERKYESDGEGDLPVQFKLVDRTKFGPLHEIPVPYLHNAKTIRERLDILSIMALNAKMAAESLKTATDIVRMDEVLP